MDQYSSNFVKGSVIFGAAYLLYKSLTRISTTRSRQLYESESRFATATSDSSTNSCLYSEICTLSMGMLGSGLLFSVLASQHD